ncbi:MAG: dihydropteroate synthase [Microscillaceae bacterium]|nr:dihydropteroate synthase [Microscillaceae bacterium]MDW8460308.1 dihydropteroate synthase [Cytophagales bacterium]
MKKTLNLNGTLLSLEKPCVMGILNITPDSFYAGSRVQTEKEILSQAEKHLSEGATFLDVGGYSSRPNAEHISEQEELQRVLPAIRLIRQHFPQAYISVDTFRAEVAKQAIYEGASIVNDISGGSLDSEMFPTVAQAKAPYVLMHMKGTPQTMTTLTHYDNILAEILQYFAQKIEKLTELGIKDIIIDVGFGFAKTLEQNFYLLKHLQQFHTLGLPLLVGLSRKSMIWRTLQISPEEALNGTTALNMVALLQGATILRVHDVKEAMQTITLWCNL